MILNEKQIPLFYHPTNVIMLDDDISMLNNLSLKISDQFPYVLYDSPEKAFDYLKSHCFSVPTLSALLTSDNVEQPIINDYTETYDICLSKLQQDLTSASRFKKSVTLIVDYHMPQMTGHEFCQIVREANFPCKIILLTGVAGNEEAIKAFNAGIIDAYVDKNDKDIYQKLNFYLQNFSLEVFQELSSELSGILKHKFTALNDKQFKENFLKVLSENNIVEYYIINSNCDFLLIDEQGQSKIFVNIPEHSFNELYDVAKDNGASYKALQAIKEKQQYPFLSHEHPAFLHFQDEMWESHLQSINKISGRDMYYMILDKQVSAENFSNYVGSVWPEP